MPSQTRLEDYSTGHDSCAPVPLVTCGPNVNINGKGAGRIGDQYSVHGCDVHPPHQDSIAEGSSTVFINGISGRIGDSVTLAGSVHDGSDNVFIGD